MKVVASLKVANLFSLAALTAILFGASCYAEESKFVAPELTVFISDKAPAISIENWIQVQASLKKPKLEHQENTVMAIAFLDTTPSSQNALIELSNLRTQYAESELRIVCVWSSSPKEVEQFLKGQANKDVRKSLLQLSKGIDLAIDSDKSAYQDYSINSTNPPPMMFVIGPSGVIEWMGSPQEVTSAVTKVFNGKGYSMQMGILQDRIILDYWRDYIQSKAKYVTSEKELNEAMSMVDNIAEQMKRYLGSPIVASMIRDEKHVISSKYAIAKFKESPTEQTWNLVETIRAKTDKLKARELDTKLFPVLLEYKFFSQADKVLARIAEEQFFDPYGLCLAVDSASEAIEDYPAETQGLLKTATQTAYQAIKRDESLAVSRITLVKLLRSSKSTAAEIAKAQQDALAQLKGDELERFQKFLREPNQ